MFDNVIANHYVKTLVRKRQPFIYNVDKFVPLGCAALIRYINTNHFLGVIGKGTGNVPSTSFDVAMTAPVLPALTMADAPPSRIRRAATRIEESRLRRTAVAAASSIVITSLA